MPSASSLYAVSGIQLIKLIKSVTSLVLKKVTTIVCVFVRKAPTKNKMEPFGPIQFFKVTDVKESKEGPLTLLSYFRT